MLADGLVPGRFIPAGAGNAWPTAACSTCTTVHPYIRGERSTGWAEYTIEDGSPPHARGTLDLGAARNFRNRFIPACAGNATGITLQQLQALHP